MHHTFSKRKNMRPPLWEHQKKAKAKRQKYYALHFDPGCGKSRTSLEFYNESEAGKFIIFAPLNVCRNWQNEVLQFCDKTKTVFICAGQPKPKKIKIIKDFLQYQGVAALAINIECLRSKEYVDLLITQKWRFVIADEFHNFKTFDSAQTKGLDRFLKAVRPEYFYPLTGTPAPQGEIDLYSTFYYLRKIDLPFYVFRKKYFNDVNNSEAGTKYCKQLHEYLFQNHQTNMPFGVWRQYVLKNLRGRPSSLRVIYDFLLEKKAIRTNFIDWFGKMVDNLKTHAKYVVKPEAKALFEKWLLECSMSANKNEVLDLPPLIHTKAFSELPASQRKLYTDMYNKLWAEDENGNSATAKTILTRTMRLMQISCGILGDKIVDDSRLKALDYCIDLVGKNQAIIWTIFTPTYDQLASHLEKKGLTYCLMTGRESGAERQKNLEDFQAGKYQFMIGNQRAAGVGVNVTAASYMIYYTKDFNLVSDVQSEARNYRGGSERHDRITRIDIVAEDTIEERVTQALLEKRSVQDFLLSLKEKDPNAENWKADPVTFNQTELW